MIVTKREGLLISIIGLLIVLLGTVFIESWGFIVLLTGFYIMGVSMGCESQ